MPNLVAFFIVVSLFGNLELVAEKWAIDCGDDSVILLGPKKRLHAFGYNTFGELGNGREGLQELPGVVITSNSSRWKWL